MGAPDKTSLKSIGELSGYGYRQACWTMKAVTLQAGPARRVPASYLTNLRHDHGPRGGHILTNPDKSAQRPRSRAQLCRE